MFCSRCWCCHCYPISPSGWRLTNRWWWKRPRVKPQPITVPLLTAPAHGVWCRHLVSSWKWVTGETRVTLNHSYSGSNAGNLSTQQKIQSYQRCQCINLTYNIFSHIALPPPHDFMYCPSFQAAPAHEAWAIKVLQLHSSWLLSTCDNSGLRPFWLFSYLFFSFLSAVFGWSTAQSQHTPTPSDVFTEPK